MSEERQDYALTVMDPAAVMPVMRLDVALDRRSQMVEFVKKIMLKDTDFGVIPGTGNKPTLLKPGAEKLTTFFGLTKRFGIVEKVEDWDKPFFYYLYRCSLYRGDLLIAEADGSCNSHESKYRYRQGERLCPKCNQSTIRKSKPPKSGWYCWAKIGGCGEQFRAGDPAIEGQVVGRVENKDVADQTNTIQKMAQKRALVAATLLAVNASEFFTQDVEDQQEEEEHRPEEPTQPAEQFSEKPTNAPNGSGKPKPAAISKPEQLLTHVNQHVLAVYDNIWHLREAVQKVLGDQWSWPAARDEVGWLKAADAAISYARSKEAPGEQSPMLGMEKSQ